MKLIKLNNRVAYSHNHLDFQKPTVSPGSPKFFGRWRTLMTF